MALSPDLPSRDPAEDLYGHAPFAEQLAKSITRQQGEAGLVLALHGPWGSGKTTVLGYVHHFLRKAEADHEIVVVDFNPWWFAGRDDLAQAFLRQLRAVLPTKSEKLKGLGSLLGDFAENIGGVLDLTGVTHGFGGPGGKLLARLTQRKPQNVPALKAKISEALRKAKVRVLVIIDDIDRLDDAEVRELFTVVKALADFPYVTYLMAFDHAVASKAIEAESHLPGNRYLEKIIQVPFHLPVVDRVALRSALFKKLDEVIAGTPDGAFDQGHWANVYFDGIDPFIEVPRDIVRLTNTLAVTYPAVLGEVNAVDFIAVEAIRVFLPALYDTLRANPDKFAGHGNAWGSRDKDADKGFHERWAADVAEKWRFSTRALLERLFPKLQRSIHGSDWLKEWRRARRVCHPEVFPVYFRLSLPPGAAGHAEMVAFIATLDSPGEFKKRLLAARDTKRPDGISKARELLERLMDFVEKDVIDAHVPVAIEALLDIGDELLDPGDERGMFDFGNDMRVTRPAYHLLKRVDKAHRRQVLEQAIGNGRGLAVQVRLLSSLEREVAKEEEGGDPALLKMEEVKALQAAWAARARALIQDPAIVTRGEFRWVLQAWKQWGDATELRRVCAELIASDAGLLVFLGAFLQHTKSMGMTDRMVKVRPRLNPAWLEPFVDTEAVAARLMELRERGGVPDAAQVTVSQFLKERDVRAAGKDPDAFGWPDDD